jgi:hypothetical protein
MIAAVLFSSLHSKSFAIVFQIQSLDSLQKVLSRIGSFDRVTLQSAAAVMFRDEHRATAHPSMEASKILLDRKRRKKIGRLQQEKMKGD